VPPSASMREMPAPQGLFCSSLQAEGRSRADVIADRQPRPLARPTSSRCRTAADLVQVTSDSRCETEQASAWPARDYGRRGPPRGGLSGSTMGMVPGPVTDTFFSSRRSNNSPGQPRSQPTECASHASFSSLIGIPRSMSRACNRESES
jgi:hypothetical protein